MKIYEIGTGYTPIPARIGAATEIVVEELTNEFLKKRVEVEILDIACDNRKANTLPVREVKIPGMFSGTDIQLGIRHKLKRVVYSVRLAFTLNEILKNEKGPVVLHFHNQYNGFFFLKLVSKRLRNKTVMAYTNHSGIWSNDWSEIEKTVHRRYFQELECMKKADLVFALNEKTKQNLIMHLNIPENRILQLGNGVNTEVYKPCTEAEKRELKIKYGLDGKTIILQVGSVNENKGQLRTLSYLLPALKEDPALMFLYVGGIVDEDYARRILSFAEENAVAGQACYLGSSEPGAKLNELYNLADATILSSRYEAFVMVVMESLSAGVPVYLEKNGPVPIYDGCIMYDSSATASGVADILRDAPAYRRLCMAARDNIVSNYSWGKIADDYLSAFAKEEKKHG